MCAKLSDRIISSVSDIKDQLVSHPFFVQMLLKGEPPNGKRVVSKYYKVQSELRNLWIAAFESGVKKSETDQEKQLMEQLIPMTDVLLTRFETLFKEKFGSFDTTVSVDDITKSPLTKQLIEEGLNAQILELLVRVLSTFYVVYLMANLKSDPRFKPNWYYDFFVADYDQLEGLFNALKALIDSKESKVSGEQEKHFIETFRRALAWMTSNLDKFWN